VGRTSDGSGADCASSRCGGGGGWLGEEKPQAFSAMGIRMHGFLAAVKGRGGRGEVALELSTGMVA